MLYTIKCSGICWIDSTNLSQTSFTGIPWVGGL